VKAQETQQNVFGNPSLPSWKNITVTVAGDGKSFTVDNADNLTWTFQYGANKYPSIYQSGVQIVKDELWMLQVYDGSWKDIGSSVNVFYKQVTSYNVAVTQTYTSKNGNYNVTWDFYGGFRPKISLSANITIAGNYRIDWRTYVYKDYAVNMTNYVKFWNGVEEAVVFDYSDVYEAFGNITMVEGVEGWVKGKRFDLVFNVGSLPIGVFRLDPNFGYETMSTDYPDAIEDIIRGSVFSITEDGTADSITVGLHSSATAGRWTVKCAIYKHSDLSLVGATAQRTNLAIATSGTWYTFTFADPKPSLFSGTAYVLVVWAKNDASYTLYLHGTTGTTNQGHYQGITYDGFPDPLVPTHNTRKSCIYCTYTVAPSGYALNLRVMDWDLADVISGATVYKDTDTKTSNGGGWANWTGVSGTVAIQVKYFGFWVNGSFSVTMNADKTINVKCKLYDAIITAKPNNNQGVLYGVNVTAYNNTGNSNGKIKSGITATLTGQVTLTNVPNATLRFIMYAKSDYSIIIANTTQLISSDDYSFNIVANLNYAVATLSFGYEAIIWMNALSVLHLLGIVSIIVHKKLKKRNGGEKACMQEKHV
jgi:hypothetical protein